MRSTARGSGRRPSCWLVAASASHARGDGDGNAMDELPANFTLGKPPASGSNLQDLPETASPDSASSTTHATSTSSGAQAAVTASRNNRRRRRDRASDQAAMDSARPCRTSIKSHRGDWRSELRTNCLKRVKKDRISLLWKIRAQGRLPANDMV
nr:unnamed protein product [Digitaria exilis]